jgi:hypothetical protein
MEKVQYSPVDPILLKTIQTAVVELQHLTHQVKVLEKRCEMLEVENRSLRETKTVAVDLPSTGVDIVSKAVALKVQTAAIDLPSGEVQSCSKYESPAEKKRKVEIFDNKGRFSGVFDASVCKLLDEHFPRGSVDVIQPSLEADLRALFSQSSLDLSIRKEVEKKLSLKVNRMQRKLKKISDKSELTPVCRSLYIFFFVNLNRPCKKYRNNCSHV